MNAYKESLFDAFVWTQAVESAVGDLAELVGMSRRSRKRASFCRLINYLKQDLDSHVYKRLHRLRKDRNDVVHESNYVESVLAGSVASELFDNDEEIRRFKELTVAAGDLYGYLVNEVVDRCEKERAGRGCLEGEGQAET